MSNFLNNLIARAAQRAPVLERRRPALFEPVSPWTPVPATNDYSAGPVLESPDVSHRQEISPLDGDGAQQQPAAPVPAVGDVAVQPKAQRRDFEASPGTPSQRTEKTRQIDVPSATPTDVRRAVASTETAPDVRAGNRFESTSNPVRPKPDAPALESSITSSSPVIARQRAARVSEIRSRSRSTTGPVEERRTPAATLPLHDKDAATNSIMAPSVPAIARAVQLAKASQPSSGNRLSPDARSEAPSVQITIGRVEVRATTSAERPAMRAKPVAPRLTLDDYLRDRNQGQR